MITKVACSNDLERFYKGSALTIEGLSKSSFVDWVNALFIDLIDTDSTIVYEVGGKLMNQIYDLHGTNAYSNDITIAVIELDSFKKDRLNRVAIDRLNYGGRWFDDIVNNNNDKELN